MIRHLPTFCLMVFVGAVVAFIVLNWAMGCGEGGFCMWEDGECSLFQKLPMLT